MHRSRLGGFIIDCHTENLEEAAEFWSRALGFDIKPSSDPDDKNYVLLDTGENDLHIEVQKVDHPSRVHLDIAADDIEAEVRRLEQLGATRVKKVSSWWVMQAPTGHRFCVVHPEQPDFIRDATEWQD